jgi:hypothetical protein
LAKWREASAPDFLVRLSAVFDPVVRGRVKSQVARAFLAMHESAIRHTVGERRYFAQCGRRSGRLTPRQIAPEMPYASCAGRLIFNTQ